METPRAFGGWGNYGWVGDGDVSRRTFLGPDHVLLPRYMHSTRFCFILRCSGVMYHQFNTSML